MYSSSNHTFAVCAYKESPYLEECLQSLLAQTVEANILIATSTPNEYIESLSKRYSISLHVSDTEPGIASDWNHAVDFAETELVTIAHQDDVYEPAYLENMLLMMNESNDPLLYFTNYGEMRNGERIDDNQLLRVKRTMLAPLKRTSLRRSRFVRRRILSFGSPICCPSVTLVKNKITPNYFKDDYRSNLDWQAWAALALQEGDFLYNPSIMMYHRIHEDSETSHLIEDSSRGAEDLRMLQSFWPKPIAAFVYRWYSKGEKSNQKG
ncbi:glycosyltransferase family A protein [Raoultibacter phocaeensis]|uniref:glycosyltransferase family A protein n=1 Tax=Raoultibacter phocaeensis TaxID=2479841 RepID=UPI00111AA0A4|nr:glycosyltransferase family 2 protein [Raoultibacter phocaeensis]